MSFKGKTVRDLIHYEYAKLIAIAINNGYPDKTSERRSRGRFWGTLWAMKKRLDNGTISPSSLLRENKMLVNSDRACAYCGSEGTLEWEHIIPLARGGPDSIDNLVLACRPCNAAKGTKDIYAMYRSRTHEAPRVVWGKYLKLLRDAHIEAGSSDATEYPPGIELSRMNLASVFVQLK